MSSLPKSIDRLRQEAKVLGKKEGIFHTAALEFVARSYGFPNWKAILNADEYSVSKKSDGEESIDPPDDVKTRILKNKMFFVSQGIEFSIFQPTITGLKKSILDATIIVRSHFESENFHFYNRQMQGSDHKIITNAYFVTNNTITKTSVSLYRPKTKKGDPRMWFSSLPKFANPSEQIAIVVFSGELYLFNFSRISFNNLASGCPTDELIACIAYSFNNIAAELLKKLKAVAKNPIKVDVKGDTAVGMAVELALNIVANNCKQPDYKGIELKAGRNKKTRSTLFAQVADWSISPYKSSADILNKYGYWRGNDFKLYCTVSTQKINNQGLSFFYDELLDQLIEKDRCGENVAIWPGELLRKRLCQKHAETFWIHAKSIMIDGVEYFDLISVTHTKSPLKSQLLPLIKSGVITMDHLIKRKGGSKPTVSEKGPLFKIGKHNLAFLFPEPKVYSLKENNSEY